MLRKYYKIYVLFCQSIIMFSTHTGKDMGRFSVLAVWSYTHFLFKQIITYNLFEINAKHCISSKRNALYIIDSARNCISSKRSFVYHQAERLLCTPKGVMRYNSLCELMIYTLKRGDIPNLSAWIKKSRSEERDFLVAEAGLEPTTFGL